MLKGLKIAAAVVGTAGGIAGGVTTITNVVEQLNYQNIHEITITDTYTINGEEVDYETWMETKDGLDNVTTHTETNTINVMAEEETTFYYGAVDSLTNFELTALVKVELEQMVDSYSCNIKSGNVELEEGQYPVVVLPEAYIVKSWKTAGFTLPMDMINRNGANIFHLTKPTYDEDIGGINYTLEFGLNV